MSLSGGTVSLPVRPDATGFGGLLHAGVMAESSGLGALGLKLGGVLLGGMAALGIGRKLGEFISTGISEFSDADAANAQLRAGMVSTGNVANLNVQAMNDLAASIQTYSGQTDDSIMKTEQILQTFTNIRNVGADKIFDQTTKAAADMAAKLGGDASSSAIQLGKALNDPIKGMTALRRVGVSFTQEQQDQVQAMQESGDVMGAQKVILAELSKEFGGAAEAAGKTLPGMVNRLKRSFEDFAQTVATAVLPNVMPVLDGMLVTFQRIERSEGFQSILGKLTDFSKNESDKLVAFFDRVQAVFESDSKTPLTDLVDMLTKANPLFSVLVTVVEAIKPALPSLFDAFQKIAIALVPVIPQLGNVAQELLPALLQVVLAILPALPSLADLLVAVSPALTSIADALGYMVSLQAGTDAFFGGLIKNASEGKSSFGDFLGLLISMPESLQGMIQGVSNFIIGGVNLVIDALNGLSTAVAFAMNPIAALLNLPGRITPFQIPHLMTATYEATAVVPTGKANGVVRAAAAGATFMPQPGGHLVNLAEAGRAETVVDTATLQAAIANRGGNTFHIYEATSAQATAMQVARYNNSLAAA